MKSLLIVVSVVLGCVLCVFVFKLVYEAGAFETITPHFNGHCLAIPDIPGAEDIEFSKRMGLVFISSDLRPENSRQEGVPGNIFSLATTSENANPVKIVDGSSLSYEFHPHGLAILETGRGVRLWVINHRSDKDTVEVFDFDGKTARHVVTHHGLNLINANDLVAVDENRFYVTHDHSARTQLFKTLEDYLRIGRGFITYFDGHQFLRVVSGLSFANGIALAPDRLVLAEMLGRRLKIYRRDVSTGNLTDERSIDLGHAPDNITWQDTDTLLVGVHPNLFKLKAQSRDHSRRAPAMILKVSHLFSATPEITEIFADDGKIISASSVATAVSPQRIFLGSIFDNKILDCRLAK